MPYVGEKFVFIKANGTVVVGFDQFANNDAVVLTKGVTTTMYDPPIVVGTDAVTVSTDVLPLKTDAISSIRQDTKSKHDALSAMAAQTSLRGAVSTTVSTNDGGQISAILQAPSLRSGILALGVFMTFLCTKVPR